MHRRDTVPNDQYHQVIPSSYGSAPLPTVAAHLAVFYAACLSNITPPVCVAAFAGAAIANADPMKTGLAALKYGITLILMPFTFAYVPGLLLDGTTAVIVHSTIAYFLGVVALAIAVQGTEPIAGRIGPVRRALFGIAALILLFPANILLDAVAIAVLTAAILPSLPAVRRRTAT